MEPLSQVEEPSRFLGELADRHLDGGPEPHDQRDRERPATETALVTAAIEQRLEPHLGIVTADVQGADPLWPVDLVRREAEQVDLVAPDVQRDLAHGLGGIGVEDDAAFVAKPADLADRVDRADLVVRRHDGDQHRLIGECSGHRFGRYAAVLVAIDDRDVPSLASQPLHRVEDGLVLG